MNSKTRVLIVDDHPMFRRGIREGLERHQEFSIVGEAKDGESAVTMTEEFGPDVVLMDINLPGASGLEVTRSIKKRHPDMAVVMVSMHQDDEQLFNAIRAGAAAYCTKDVECEELATAIRRVAKGDFLINENVLMRPHVASRVLSEFRELSQMESGSGPACSPLTNREVEILDCVAQGNSNKEIARRLTISDQTVKNHITSILRKLSVNDRTQAVLYALRHGWIKLDERLVQPLD